MALRLRFMYPGGTSDTFVKEDEELLTIVRQREPMPRATAVEEYLIEELRARKLEPVDDDWPELRSTIEGWARGNAPGDYVAIRLRELAEQPTVEGEDRKNLLRQLQEALAEGSCLWVTYDNEVAALDLIRQAAGKAKVYVWNVANRWTPELPNVTYRDDAADRYAGGLRGALDLTTPDPVWLVFQDVPISVSFMENRASPALLTELVRRITAERNNARLLVLRPEAEIPARWSGLFRLFRLNLSRTGTPVLDALAADLTARARDGKLEKLVGREEEVTTVLDILNRAPGLPNSPLLVGKAGVGKTAILEGLAVRINEGNVPERFKNRRVMSLSATALGAGTQYAGSLEARLQALIHELEAHASRLIVFIDEIHTIMQVGGGGSPAVQALKASLGRGHISIVGATTDQEAAQVEADPAFARRFFRVVVKEPTVEQTFDIALGWKERLEQHHNIKIDDALVRRAIDEATWHLVDQSRPYSAISLLGHAASVAERRAKGRPDEPLTIADLNEALRMTLGMEVNRSDAEEQERLSRIEADLKSRVMGQDEAIRKVMLLVRGRLLNKSRRWRQPLCMLLVGPSGVGKTEMAMQLGQQLFDGVAPVIYHMEAYRLEHQVTDLLGAPPSYVGYERGSRLVNDIRTRPRTVIVIDEVEKAAPEVVLALMGILDRGEYKDPRGLVGDFRHAIFMVTTNVVTSSEDLALEGEAFDKRVREGFQAMERPPELVGRFGAIVKFRHLPEPVLIDIARKQIEVFQKELRDDYGVDLICGADAIQALVDRTKDQTVGVRPIIAQITELRGRVVEAIFCDNSRRLELVRGQNGLRIASVG